MGADVVGFFVFLVLVNLSAIVSTKESNSSSDCNCTSNSKVLDRYASTIVHLGAGLGSLLLVETLFCCYVLYTWARNFRINSGSKMKNQGESPEEDDTGPMYTDADEGDVPLPNYQALDPSPPLDLAPGPGYQPLSKKRNEFEKMISKKLLTTNHDKKPNKTQSLKTTAHALQSEEEDVGGLVYSQPYEDSVSAASQLIARGAGSFRGKKNQEPAPKDEKQLVYYHVLEEQDSNQPSPKSTPLKPHLMARQDQRSEDVYYYCDSENSEYKKEATPSSNEPEDDVYYSCSVEEPSKKQSRTNSIRGITYKKANTPNPPASQYQHYYHELESQSEGSKKEPANKSTLKPLKGNQMMNVHVIQEMKTRVANKKSGD